MITAAFAQRVTAVACGGERLTLLHTLAVLHYKRAAGQMRVMAELAVAVIDSDVVAERMMPMILPQSQIVRVRNPALHCHHAASRVRRDVERVQAVAPMRERTVRSLRNDPRHARCRGKF